MMRFDKHTATSAAIDDLAARLGTKPEDIATIGVLEADFPDLALGAPVSGEVAGQMMVSGWRIILSAHGKQFEYRASDSQVRLFRFEGKNLLIKG
jgi:hypothetical protein